MRPRVLTAMDYLYDSCTGAQDRVPYNRPHPLQKCTNGCDPGRRDQNLFDKMNALVASRSCQPAPTTFIGPSGRLSRKDSGPALMPLSYRDVAPNNKASA